MEILTQIKTFDPNRNWDSDEYGVRLVDEQFAVLQANGIEICDSYLIKLDNYKYIIADIDNGIQMLALKEGADLVKFDNGNLGFIGYYGNTTYDKGNCFEVVCKADLDALLDKFGNEYPISKAKEEFKSEDWNFEWSDDLYVDHLVDKLNRR